MRTVRAPSASVAVAAGAVVAVVLGVIGGLGDLARADDAPRKDREGNPLHGGAHMAPEARALLPKGWSLRTDDAAKPAAEATLTSVARDAARAAGADPDALRIVLRSLSGPAGASATLGLVDADEKPADVAKAIEAAARGKGWGFRAMGGPSRLLVVAAPAAARDAIVAAQVAWAAESLSARADAVFAMKDPKGCLAVTDVALALDPKNAHAHWVANGPLWCLAYLKVPHDSFAPAIGHIRAALDAGATYPFSPVEREEARGLLAFLLMLEGAYAEARALLVDVVAHRDVLPAKSFWTHRYNLACAHAQLEEADAAFAHLEAVLAQDAEEPVFGVEPWREEHEFDALHGDPRWKALLEKYPAPAGDGD